MSINRRKAMGQILGIAGTMTGAALIGPKALAADHPCNCCDNGVGTGGTDLEERRLPYVRLDPLVAAKEGYEGYWRKHCSYGCFQSILKPLADELRRQGRDEDAERVECVPTNVAAVGQGGMLGYGSLCGALTGIAMAVNILELPGGNATNAAVLHAIFRYYEKTSIPVGDVNESGYLKFIGAPSNQWDDGSAVTQEQVGASVAGSVLCHASVTNWSISSGYGIGSKAFTERCAQVTSDISYIAVKFLNDALDGKLDAPIVAPANEGCISCHGQPGDAQTPDNPVGASNVMSGMECASCHAPHPLDTTPVHPDFGGGDLSDCLTCHK
ncbi:C-GCAxxG-C-C family (seleno)protein [Ferrimonas marina]|uniref:Putative redox-active protein (C_GCAxxG_C_C) n=1 Tax=Ferrimonas marina TaxID=299255 RepID=A0A1M5X1B2_9GAMM|nr:C-GCAxxG-C-C family (seleno)protein [Ferrimonas marina]SHH93637.1 Putative redox-active protein (C_GCAxxG_C_C) [Ferrimonas marina]